MHRRLPKSIRRLSELLGLERDWYLVSLAAVIGLIMGTVAVAYIWPLHQAERLAREIAQRESTTLFWILIGVVPAIGALLGGLVHYLIKVDMNLPGVPRVMFSIHRRKSKIQARYGIRKWLASTFTIASGGSAGAEGPIVTIGSVIGSNIAQRLNANPQNTATLLGCGAAAGISAVFNAPIAGIFFVMEILLRDFSLRTFTPIVIASVISAAWCHGLLADYGAIFEVSKAAFQGPSEHLTVMQVPNYILLGLICGIAAAVFIRALSFSEDAFARLRIHPILKPTIGGGMLGLLGVAMVLFSGSHDDLPHFYGNGYPVIQELLSPDYYMDPSTGELSSGLTIFIALGALAIVKALATCLTIGSGGAGGMFAPSLLVGASLGGCFGYIINLIGLFPSASPATYAIVGMAAMVAATTHAPLTGILIVYEITQSYEVILPLMLAAVISTIVGRLAYGESIYTQKLTTVGVRLGAMSDLTVLRRLDVSDLQLTPSVSVRADDSASRLLHLSEDRQVGDFVVVDDRDMYVGMVTNADLKSALVYREAIPLLQVNELMRSDLPTVAPDESLDIVLDKFSRYDVQSLPVLSESGNGTVLGLVTRTRLITRYQRELSEE